MNAANKILGAHSWLEVDKTTKIITSHIALDELFDETENPTCLMMITIDNGETVNITGVGLVDWELLIEAILKLMRELT